MELTAAQLGGMPREQAECFGKPHWDARYVASDDRHVLIPGATCLACGHSADSAHHEPQKGMGGAKRTWTMRTPMGQFVLRPALIALCGSGTTGCHGKRHNGLLRIRWKWTDPWGERAWWSGELLSKGMEPHDPLLYSFGRWEVI